jgi:cell fate regulator YaaT (PSP1 superfamily)
METPLEPVANVLVTGAPTRFAGVRFQSVGKVYHFDASAQADLRVGDYVIVETARGRQIGEVASVEPFTDKRPTEGPLKPIERRASGRDLAIRKYWEGKELEAVIICREANKSLGLPIKIVKAEYSFDGTRLTFLYSADSEEEKVDTKDLRQEITKSFRARIEMKLVGPRDVAKFIGGFGACGEVRCCSRFLTEFSPVSIKMAKEQGISLNPQEITGMCGRLRCCLVYEYEQYVLARKSLPSRNKEIGTPHGRGTVIDILPLRESVLVQVGEQQFEVHREQIVPLEEWEALQKRAAEPCQGGENCTCGLHKPESQMASKDQVQTSAVSKPDRGQHPEQGERRSRRDQRQNRRAERQADKPASSKPAGDAPGPAGRRSPRLRKQSPQSREQHDEPAG